MISRRETLLNYAILILFSLFALYPVVGVLTTALADPGTASGFRLSTDFHWSNFSDAWFRGEEGSEDYPLFIKPDRPLALADVMGLMRDHYEGTPYDMTKGAGAGPFGSPLRARDLKFTVDGKDYMWERPISTQQAGFVVVNQMRASLPDAVGGVSWFTPDDASTSCFTPLYCSIDALPAAYANGDYGKFSWDSAWWVTNLVSNLTYDRWSRVFPDVKKAQADREGALLKMQPVVEETATKLAADEDTVLMPGDTIEARFDSSLDSVAIQ